MLHLRLRTWTINGNTNPLSKIGIVDKKVEVTIRRENKEESSAIYVTSGTVPMKNATRSVIDPE